MHGAVALRVTSTAQGAARFTARRPPVRGDVRADSRRGPGALVHKRCVSWLRLSTVDDLWRIRAAEPAARIGGRGGPRGTSAAEDLQGAARDGAGTRLTELAARSNMTRPAMAELVDELEQAGYLDRRLDPSDGRAKLIRPTRKGRRVLAQALRAVEDIEHGYAEVVGAERFDALVSTLQALLDARPRGSTERRR